MSWIKTYFSSPQMDPVKYHIMFMYARVCGKNSWKNFNNENFIDGFNKSYSVAYKSITNDSDLFDMEDIYIQALSNVCDIVMEQSFNGKSTTMGNKIIIILQERIKKLRNLRGKME